MSPTVVASSCSKQLARWRTAWWTAPTERTAGVVGRAASVVIAPRTRTDCSESIVCQTALGSVTVWQTAQQMDTRFLPVVSHTARTA